MTPLFGPSRAAGAGLAYPDLGLARLSIGTASTPSHYAGCAHQVAASAQIIPFCAFISEPEAGQQAARIGGSLRGRAKTQVALRDRLPSASVLGWQSSRLPTDYVGMAEVWRRAPGARPCPVE